MSPAFGKGSDNWNAKSVPAIACLAGLLLTRPMMSIGDANDGEPVGDAFPALYLIRV